MYRRSISDELTELSSPFSDVKEIYSFTDEVKHFSNETVHIPGHSSSGGRYEFPFQRLDTILVHSYANGIGIDDVGYVSVVFEIPYIYDYKYLEFTCVFTVIDASGNERFPKSYVFPFHSGNGTDSKNNLFTITVDKLLNRKFILNDKDDLLPGDCLKLQINVVIRMVIYPSFISNMNLRYLLQFFDCTEESDDEEKYLYLDSILARRLAEVSTFFKTISEIPMVERTTRYMKIANEEFLFFLYVCQIVMGVEAITVRSISDICQMYAIADKYIIPIAIKGCRNLVTALLRVESDPVIVELVKENIPTLLELAEKYNDVRLKENVESFLKRDLEGTENDRCTQKGLQSDGMEWKLENLGIQSNFALMFIQNIKEEPKENFYQ